MKKLLLMAACSFAWSYSTVAQQLVTTLAGSATSGSVNGTGSAASFNGPSGVCFDISGNVYVADQNNNIIRKITPAGVVTTLAGSGVAGLVNGTGTAAAFNQPSGLCADLSGNIYVADSYNNVIRMITPAGVVTTLAGSGGQVFADGPGLSAQFNSPYGICFDPISGNLYVADQSNRRIRQITLSPNVVVSTIAGTGVAGAVNGAGSSATFDAPTGVCTDASGNVYVADQNNNMIRKITTAGVVSTYAGSGTSGNTNGTGTAAQFDSPTGVSADLSGNIYVADYSNHKIRKIDPSTVVTTLAGFPGFGYTNGNTSVAQFYGPIGISSFTGGILYVADRFNNSIRMISPCTAPNAPSASSTATSVCIGQSTTLTATGTGTISWYTATVGGTAIATGTAYATSATLTAGTYTFYAESATTCTVSASRTPVTVTINAAPTAPANATSASDATVCTGNAATLTASSAGNISWFVSATGGTAIANGATYVTSNTLAAGIYTMYAEAATCTVSASRTPVTYTVVTCCVAPPAPLTATVPGVYLNNSATLIATGTGTINWYTTATGGTAIGTGTALVVTPTVVSVNSYTYYAEALTCTTSAVRTPVTLQVFFGNGINELRSQYGVSVYPNPTNGMFIIESAASMPKTIEVSDMTGRVILSSTTSDAKTQVNLNAFATGIYYVKVKLAGATEVIKVVKQ